MITCVKVHDMFKHAIITSARIGIMLLVVGIVEIAAIDQKIKSLKSSIETIAQKLSSCDKQCTRQQKQFDPFSFNRGPFGPFNQGPWYNSIAMAGSWGSGFNGFYYPPNQTPLPQPTIEVCNYMPHTVGSFFDSGTLHSLQQALMAGLFIDDFADPLAAAYVVGLAAKIYQLYLGDNHQPKTASSLIFAGTCSTERFTVSGNVGEYKDLIVWAQREFSTNKQLNLTAKQLLHQTINTDKLLRTVNGQDYDAASAYWDGTPPTASSAYSVMSVPLSIKHFEPSKTSITHQYSHPQVMSSVRNKIAAFKEQNIKK